MAGTVSKYDVPTADVLQEHRFYTDANQAHDHIESLKEALQARNEEFQLLLEYYERNRGVLDVHHRPACGPRAMRPNLGSKDQTWYYLDGAGNKIWVRNLELDTSDPHCGAFQGTGLAGDGRIVVVQVPKVRYQYNVQQDYRKKLAEFDASYRLPVSERTRRQSARAQAAWERDAAALYDEQQDNLERYIAGQEALAGQLTHLRPSRRPEYVWRPPSTVQEAELRLAELKREAAQLEAEREQQAAAAVAAASRAKALQL